MHLNILSPEQTAILPYLPLFKRSFYLVGGTAIALQLGHRQSIDFDLFSSTKINKPVIKQKIDKIPFPKRIIFEDIDQLHYLINGVKITFFHYPFAIAHNLTVNKLISMPELIDLAAMKAYALGRRSKWKDYVDLYYLLKGFFSIDEICKKAQIYYGEMFSEKLFRQQLAFHKDIDYSENIEYLESPIPEKEIKAFLIEKATDL